MAHTASEPCSRVPGAFPPTPWAMGDPQFPSEQIDYKENKDNHNGREGNGAVGATTPVRTSGRTALKGAYAVQRFLEIFSDEEVDSTRLTPIRRLGAGAFARVTLCSLQDAVHPPKKQLVAVKELREDIFDEEKDVISFFHETQLLRKLVHPAIVTFVGVSYGDLSAETNARLGISIVQEHMTCGSLKDIILEAMKNPKRNVYSKREALKWLLQIAQGLAYLHELKSPVIHRDLKIENILITEDESGARVAKLADFGLSAMIRRKDSGSVSAKRCSSSVLSSRQSLASRQSMTSNMDRMSLGRKSLGRKSLGRKSVGIAGGAKRIGSNLMKHMSISRLHEAFDDIDFGGDDTSIKFADAKAQFKRRPSLVDQKVYIENTHNLSKRTGSLMYMAPEVYRGLKYNQSVDVFSFSMVFYELMRKYLLLCFVYLEGSMEEIEIYAETVADGFRPPIPKTWPLKVKQLIRQCWSHTPTKRPTMREIANRLEDMCNCEEFLEELEPAKNSQCGCACPCSIQ